MRLEILVGNDDPVVYPLNTPKVTIGSSEDCDIPLYTDGVSRKHISVIVEGDVFYVVDFGSTNGSFINEERLIPGRRAEFTSFFPVRLGQNVLISLLSDEEAGEPIELPHSSGEKPSSEKKTQSSNSDKTTVINLRELYSVKTEKLITLRNEKRASVKKRTDKPAPPVKKKKKNFTPLLSAMLFTGAFVYNIFFRAQSEVEPPPGVVGRIITEEVVKVEAPKLNSDLIPDDELVKKESYWNYLNELKCTTDVENLLCDFFPNARGESFGAVQIGLTAHVLVNASSAFEMAKTIITRPENPTPESLTKYENLLYDTTAYIYLLNSIKTNPLDISRLGDFKIFIALFAKVALLPKLVRVIAIKPSMINKLNSVVLEDNLVHIRSSGASALAITNSHYRSY